VAGGRWDTRVSDLMKYQKITLIELFYFFREKKRKKESEDGGRGIR